MKLSRVKIILAFLGTIKATVDNMAIIIPEVTCLPNSNFIVDCNKNRTFAKFRNQYRANVEALVPLKRCRMNAEKLSIIDEHLDELVDVAMIAIYNKYCRLINVREIEDQADKSKLADELIKTIFAKQLYLNLDEVQICRIPIKGIEFYRPIKLSMNNAGLRSGVEILANVSSIIRLSLRDNLFESLPDFSVINRGFNLDLRGNKQIKITSPQDIKMHSKRVSIDLSGIEDTAPYGARLLRSYGNAIFEGYYDFRYIMQMDFSRIIAIDLPRHVPLDISSLQPVRPISNFIAYCLANKELLEFRAKYYDEFYTNIRNIKDRKTSTSVHPVMLEILDKNDSIIYDVTDVAIADYYNRYYQRWWKIFENINNFDMEREIRDDARERDLMCFTDVYLDNIVFSGIPYDAFRFFVNRKLCLLQTGITAAEVDKLIWTEDIDRVTNEYGELFTNTISSGCKRVAADECLERLKRASWLEMPMGNNLHHFTRQRGPSTISHMDFPN